MSEEQLNALISSVQADPRQMKLLHILGPQLEQLVNKGSPDLRSLFDALDRQQLVARKELQELREAFALDSVSGHSS